MPRKNGNVRNRNVPRAAQKRKRKQAARMAKLKDPTMLKPRQRPPEFRPGEL